jgi:O-antigen ligase
VPSGHRLDSGPTALISSETRGKLRRGRFPFKLKIKEIIPLSGRTVAFPSTTAVPPIPANRVRLALIVAMGFVFVVYTRFPEIMSVLLGVWTHSILITLALGLLAALLSGTVIRAVVSKTGLCMLAFTGWLCVCTAFSMWRGGSFAILRDWWLVSICSFLIVAATVQSVEECHKIMYSLAVSTAFVEISTILMGRMQGGRFAFLQGTLANANELAMILLIGTPFCLFTIRNKRGFSLLKMLCVLIVLMVPVSVVATGSRGGLLAMLLMFLLYFFRLSAGQKMVAVVAALILGFIAINRSNQDALERYKTIFGSSGQLSGAEESAIESSEARKTLLQQSLRLTAQHPLLGVGPGMFQLANVKDTESRGLPSWNAWHETHNAFTQISSEEGLPGLFFYGAALYLCFRITRVARKHSRQDSACSSLEAPAFALRLSLIAFTCTALFVNSAYSCYFPLLAGLCVAFERAIPMPAGAPEPAPKRQKVDMWAPKSSVPGSNAWR